VETPCLRAIAVGLGGVLLTATPIPSAVLAHAPATEAAVQGLVLVLAVAQREFTLTQPVEARLELRNDRATPVMLIVEQGAFDLVVYDARGAKMWAWTEGRPILLVPPERRLVGAGDRVSGTLFWDQTILRAPPRPAGKAGPGTYLVEGVLRATVLEAPRLRLKTPRLAIAVRP